jgi:pimeloyl-ACP methyl ester carboxylesterase
VTSPSHASASHVPNQPEPLTVDANGITLAYQTYGDATATPLLLVMGLATQMLGWHEEFCGQLVDAGFFVVRFDNRDIGLSTHMTDAGMPDLQKLFTDPRSAASYTLDEMADDTAGLLDALGIEAAHVVGASMGGMIAQTLAIRHPARVLSLTSIMSTPSPQIGPPTQEAAAVLLAPAAADREAAVERAVATYKVIGSPGYPLDTDELRRSAGLAYDRAFDPAGVVRQLAAIQASGDRTEGLRGVRVPTVVLPGEADPLVQPDGGRATAEAVPGAKLVTYPGMGHNLPRELWPDVVGEIVAVTGR